MKRISMGEWVKKIDGTKVLVGIATSIFIAILLWFGTTVQGLAVNVNSLTVQISNEIEIRNKTTHNIEKIVESIAVIRDEQISGRHTIAEIVKIKAEIADLQSKINNLVLEMKLLQNKFLFGMP